MLQKAMTAAQSAEGRIRKARFSNLSGNERRRFEKKIWSDLIRGAETARLSEIKNVADKLFKMQNAESPSDFMASTRELLNLERMKLRHKFTNESTAMATINGMEKRGYDEIELWVLSAISKKTNAEPSRSVKQFRHNSQIPRDWH